MLQKNNLMLFLTLLLGLTVNAQSHFEAYKLYNNKGKEISIKKLYKTVEKSENVFLGELHNNPISHWFYLNLIKHTFEHHNKKIQVGAEMFERDNQVLIDEYFTDIISTKKFENECRLWPNYSTDYKPTLEFCKENNILFTATNIPRRYASAVYKKGESVLEKLSPLSKSWIAPTPIPFDSSLIVYKELQSFSGHGGINLAKAQAYKDATMAYSIIESKKDNHIYFHLNGNKHSESHQAILWYLKQYGDKGTSITIQTETNKDLSWDDAFASKADFILVVQEDIQ